MRSAIPMGTSTFSLTLLLTIDALTWRYDLQTKRSSDLMDVPT